MSDGDGEHRKNRDEARHEEFRRRIRDEERRKLHARSKKSEGIWFGLGMIGLIGWSVAVPTVVGVAIGIWVDTTWDSPFSWTLMLLALGVALGSMNAWFWVQRERRSIEEDEEAERRARERDKNGTDA
jgi:ATP synthase protein I